MLIYRYKQKLKKKETVPEQPVSNYDFKNLTKKELQNELDRLGISYKTNDTKDVLMSLLKEGE